MNQPVDVPTYSSASQAPPKGPSFWQRIRDRNRTKKRWIRRYTLLECMLWGAAGAAFGTYAIVRINRDRDRFLAALPTPNDVAFNNTTIRLPGIMTTVGCYLTFVGSIIMLACSFFLKPNKDRQDCELACLIIFTIWLVLCVAFETGYYATSRARVSGTVNGMDISDSTIRQLENDLGIRTVYRFGFAYLLVAIICGWFAFLWTAIAAVVCGSDDLERSATSGNTASYSNTRAAPMTRADPNYRDEGKDIVEVSRTPSAPVAMTDPESQQTPDIEKSAGEGYAKEPQTL